MTLQNFNYHTHTRRCGHAIGVEEDYIKEAIEGGFDHIGFSEHIGYADWRDPTSRMAYADMENYEQEVKRLKEKYKGQINIYLGYESEYYPDLLDYYKEVRDRVDYMILGAHSLIRDEKTYLHDKAEDEDVLRMADLVEEGLSTGLFSYLCHPDYYMQARDTFSDSCQEATIQMARAAKKYKVPVELNLGGYRKGTQEIDGKVQLAYPNTKTFEIMAENKVDIVIGYDAHDPKVLANRQDEIDLKNHFKDLDLNILSEFMI